MQTYIEDVGADIVTNEAYREKPLDMVRTLLEFKSKIDTCIRDSFAENMNFQKARDESFRTFMNKFDKTPHYIALYCDNAQRDTYKQKSMEDIKSEIDDLIKLFCCLNGRDEFITAYEILLADRLLNKLSVNDEAEEDVIKKLQVECGNNIVSKIKTMFSDVSKSKELVKEFVDHNKGALTQMNKEMSVQILSTSQWPFQESLKLTPPSSIGNMRMIFTNWYDRKYKNRTLVPLYDKGSVVL